MTLHLTPSQLMLIKYTLIQSKENYSRGIRAAVNTKLPQIVEMLQLGADELQDILIQIDIALGAGAG